MFRILGTFLTVTVLALALPACTVNPATGQRQFNPLSPSEEVQIGNEASPEFIREYGGEIPSPQIQQYVTNLGQRLASVSERTDLPWEFHVVDSAEINAFALPGGKVFISRGLLAKMENEAQLAGVLGHEIGHVTAQHIGQQMGQQMAVQGVGAVLDVAAGSAAGRTGDMLHVLGVGSQYGGTVYLLKFSRDQESQADELGLRYMTRLGYNPIGQLQVMEILKREAGAGGGLEILATHPLPETRIDRLNALIKEKYPDYNATPPRYRMNADEFRQSVLVPLATLPPPRHTGQEQQPSGAQGLRQGRQPAQPQPRQIGRARAH